MERGRYTRKYLIEALQELAARLGRTPTQADTDADPHTSCRKTFVNYFGGWNMALEAAGLPPNRQPTRRDRETMLEMLGQLVDELGRVPATRDLVEHDLPCQATYTGRFGSWEAALAEIDLESRGNRLYERDELLGILRELTEELGRPPTQAELWQQERLPRPTTYKYRFGGWNRALKAAGFTPPHSRSKPGRAHHVGDDKTVVGER